MGYRGELRLEQTRIPELERNVGHVAPICLHICEHPIACERDVRADEYTQDRQMGLSDSSQRASIIMRPTQRLVYSWAQVAQRLVPRHAQQVARTIFECQAYRGEHRWFLEHSQAESVLGACTRADPDGVWAELAVQLETKERFLFVIGFPVGVVSQLPHVTILAWVEGAPEQRASLLARLVEKVYADGTLGAELLHRYRKLKGVGDTFFSALVTGTWTGNSSDRWESLAMQLDATVQTSKLKGVRDWARESSVALRQMAKEDRRREAEESLRR